jgi:hypothetical protein
LWIPRQEFIDPVDGMIGDAGKDIPQVGFWIEAVELCGLCRLANYAECLF